MAEEKCGKGEILKPRNKWRKTSLRGRYSWIFTYSW